MNDVTPALLAVFCVFFGWLLNALSANAQFRLEHRKAASKVLSRLIKIKLRIEDFHHLANELRNKKVKSSTVCRLLSKSYERGLSKCAFIEFEALLVEYANYHPILATKLEMIGTTFEKLGESIKFIEANDSESLPLEYAFDSLDLDLSFNKQLSNSLIESVARDVGLLTFIKVKFTKYLRVSAMDKKENHDRMKDNHAKREAWAKNLKL